MSGITCYDLIVCRIEHHVAFAFEQVDAEALISIVDFHQSEQGRHDIDLRTQTCIFHWLDTLAEDDERNVIITYGEFSIALSYHLAVISLNDKDRILKPRLFRCLAEEVADTPVGILYDLCLLVFCARLEPRRDDVRRMIADGQNRRQERLAALSLGVDLVERESKLEVITDAETR